MKSLGIRYTSYGGARTVTGSCHVLNIGRRRTMVDCGMFQGAEDPTKNKSLPPDLDKIESIHLTHAHLDHSGKLPYFYKNGFRGIVYSTPATKDLTALITRDSAHIMAEDARRKSYKVDPLYSLSDVEETLRNLEWRTVDYHVPIDLGEGIETTFFDAGHILGSSSILFHAQVNGSFTKKILFSGDLGSGNNPFVKDPSFTDEADVVIMESTYGDRTHKPLQESLAEYYSVINETIDFGKIFVPTLAVERAQKLLFFNKLGIENKSIPSDLEVYLDSPMAIQATEIFKNHPECFNETALERASSENGLFDFPNLHYSRTREDSISINNIRSKAIVMAGSGMCNGGRIVHHMKNNLSDKNACFIIVNYAPEGTLLRKIIDIASGKTEKKTINFFGEEIPIRAKIVTINGFSAHADQNGLLKWHSSTPRESKRNNTVLLTHGGVTAMKSLAGELVARGNRVFMPEQGKTLKLSE